MPGYEEKELAIELIDRVLTVKGEHLAKAEEKEKAFHLRERIEREFERRFELPSTVETEPPQPVVRQAQRVSVIWSANIRPKETRASTTTARRGP